MTKVVGLTGGICSGKTTVLNFIKKRGIPAHDSDEVVRVLYLRPPRDFVSFLKKTKLLHIKKNNEIDKKKIRQIIFNNKNKKMLLEKYIHKEVAISRNLFLKKNKKKVVLLDIPLLFEKKLQNICDYVILVCAPIEIRKKRAMSRKGMNKEILKKILRSQLRDSFKKKRSDFVINTKDSKKLTFEKIINILHEISNK